MNDRDASVDALVEAGVPASVSGNDLVVAGTTFAVIPMRIVRERDAELLAYDHGGGDGPPAIVVADRISEAARAALSKVGLAWFDRRGHLWVRAEGLYVNSDVRPRVAPARRVLEIFRGTGIDVAVALLETPHERHGVNELARRTGRSAGRVSEILGALRAEGLVGAENLPVVPELFWALADEWSPSWEQIPGAPPPEPPERYRLSGTLGALALGAPLAAGAGGTWPRLYVVDDVDLSAVITAYPRAGWTAAEAAVCPSRFGFALHSGTSDDGYLVAGHIVVALDLAQDRARGREVLDGWDPEGVERVW